MRDQVCVQIHEPGCHEPARGVDALEGAVGGDARRHRGDLAELDADVAPAAELLARIEHIATGDDEIERERRVGGIEASRRRPPDRLGDQGGRLRPDARRLRGERGARRCRGRGDDEVPSCDVHIQASSARRRAWTRAGPGG